MKSSRPVAIWMYTGVIMLLVQVILGGITRLTGSGLSITEWNIVTGTLPPLNTGQWQVAFDKYRQTQQFQVINADFTVSDFKFIFFWEWFHRFWARMVGVVFVVGFVWLLLKKQLQKRMIRPLLILFLLGALQGAVGWVMVLSGFTGDALYVRPTRLALHFVFALGLIVYAFWFALQLSVPVSILIKRASSAPHGGRSLRRWTMAILAVVFFQLLYGALMAGNKAAIVAPTWPDINGAAWPETTFSGRPLLKDLVGNKITVQFIHRGLAYVLLLLTICWTIVAASAARQYVSLRRLRWLPVSVLVLQILLGIFTLLSAPGIVPNHWVSFDWLAQVHQVMGLIFLLTMTGILYLVIPVRHSGTV